jgi:hypothetical protein
MATLNVVPGSSSTNSMPAVSAGTKSGWSRIPAPVSDYLARTLVRLIETYVRNYNRERERLAGDAVAVRARLVAKRDRIEGERQRNIDLVIKYVISEEDAKQRIAELKEERLRVEAEMAALEEAPVLVTLHPAALDRYISTVNALADTMAGHSKAEADRGSPIQDFRTLVHSVTVHPEGPWKGFEVEVKSKLATPIGGEVFPQAHHISGGYMAAGDRYSPKPTFEDSGSRVVAGEGRATRSKIEAKS